MTCVFFGEVLIDLALSGGGAVRWTHGGAPANACVAAARSGATTNLISTVGADFFGRSIQGALRSEGIGVDAVRVDRALPTSLGVFNPDMDAADGWISYRRADRAIEASQVCAVRWNAVRTAYVGAGSFSEHEPVDTAADYIDRARASDAVVVIDCNYRDAGWSSTERYRDALIEMLRFADVAKMNELESRLLTGSPNASEAATSVLDLGPSLVFVTLGAEGSIFSTSRVNGSIAPVGASGHDLAGAGDAFVGKLTAELARTPYEQIVADERALRELTSGCVESGRAATYNFAGGW
jgi:sugar/nucleoside kinase (ribokinase family)